MRVLLGRWVLTMASGLWLGSASEKYGASVASPDRATTKDAVAVTSASPIVMPRLAGMLSPGDPMFWFGVIAAGGVALMSYSAVYSGKG